MADTQNKMHNFSLQEFKESITNMIKASNVINGNLLDYTTRYGVDAAKDYTIEQIHSIMKSSSLEDKRTLSRSFFAKDGFYRKIIMHYAYLSKYAGLLIPNPSFGTSMTEKTIKKKYDQAINYIDKVDLPAFFGNCSVKALVNGCYFGVIQKIDNNNFIIIELPASYCTSRFKDLNGKDIVEFNLSYFNTFSGEEKKQVLATFPKVIQKLYKQYDKGTLTNSWIFLPTEISLTFKFLDGRPAFLDILPATLQYDAAIENELEKEADEIRKIIIQKIPHLTSTGELLFEPPEAEEIHKGTVGMMKGNKNVSVLTTYADVDIASSKTTNDATANTVEKMANNIYYKTGVTDQVFNATSSSAVDTSLTNDMTFMVNLIEQYSKFTTDMVNLLFSNNKLNFKYKILPITHYNAQKYMDNALKLANAGFSFLLPALALDLSQKELVNIKDMENDLLKLDTKLIPLQSAFTQSATGGNQTQDGGPTGTDPDKKNGRAKKDQSEKKETTLAKEESLDKGGTA